MLCGCHSTCNFIHYFIHKIKSQLNYKQIKNNSWCTNIVCSYLFFPSNRRCIYLQLFNQEPSWQWHFTAWPSVSVRSHAAWLHLSQDFSIRDFGFHACPGPVPRAVPCQSYNLLQNENFLLGSYFRWRIVCLCASVFFVNPVELRGNGAPFVCACVFFVFHQMSNSQRHPG